MTFMNRKWMITGAIALVAIIAGCKKENKKQGASGSTKQVSTEAECKTKTGYQWDGNACVLSTADNNQALCEAAGKAWSNNACVDKAPVNNSTTPPSTTPDNSNASTIDACTNVTTIAASVSCLDAQYTTLLNTVNALTVSASWAESVKEDMSVISKNYTQFKGRKLSEKTNIITKTMACSDVTSMRLQKSQINTRLKLAPNDTSTLNLKAALPEFTKALDLNKSTLKCVL